MLRLITSSLVLLMALAGFSQPKGIAIPEVGIDEHLGDTIPKNLTFYNEQNQLITLSQVINKPTILSFVYFDCPGLCNPLLDGLNEVIGKVDLKLGADFDVLTISFNYQDSPEDAVIKKKNFSTNISKENADHWKYLTGDSASISTILHATGFNIKQVGVDWMHPSAIILLSPDGVITRYLYGTYFLPFDLKMAVSEASKGLPRPTINKVMEYCFSFDPEGRKYKLQVTKVAGTLILGLALILFMVLGLRKRSKNKE